MAEVRVGSMVFVEIAGQRILGRIVAVSQLNTLDSGRVLSYRRYEKGIWSDEKFQCFELNVKDVLPIPQTGEELDRFIQDTYNKLMDMLQEADALCSMGDAGTAQRVYESVLLWGDAMFEVSREFQSRLGKEDKEG